MVIVPNPGRDPTANHNGEGILEVVTELTRPAVRELPGPRRGPDDQTAGYQTADPLRSIADVPAAEQDRLLWEHGEAVADHMANHFARRTPHLAARSGFAPWQRAAGAAAALGAVALLVIIPSVLTLVLAGVMALITGAQLMIAVAARWRRGSAGDDHAAAVPDAELPSYTILVPAYQEQDVIGGMVRCLEGLDYPKDRLEALILVERRDHATKQAIRDADPAEFIRIVEIPPGKPQTKPRSCNAGLLLAKGDLIVIYDAEDRPDPDQLRLVAGHFTAADDRLACVQAKLMVSNADQSFITRQFALEYCLRYELTLPGLARLGLPIPLGGTSNHFRTQLLRELGGWDAWNVTEDADLGMRCSALGYRVEVADSITYGEMPHRFKAWTKQRTRWLKGFMLTALVHTRNPARTWRTFGRAGTATMLTFMVGTPLLYLAQPVSLAIWASGYHGLDAQHLPIGYTMTITQSAIFVVWTALVVAAARRYKLVSAVFAPLLPAYWVMQWTASWRGLYQLIRAPFLWEKTEHAAVSARV
jgi:cellulose synthase/poly-beta-1,6-N-acetylglucosamine synthase-like glycosyltransferase